MRRVARWLFTLCSAGSLVLCLVLRPFGAALDAAALPQPGVAEVGARFRMKVRRERPYEFVPRDLLRATCWVKFSTHGKRLLAGSHDRVSIWTVPEMRQVIEPLHLAPGVEFADLSPDGSLVLTADRRGVLQVWDVGDAGVAVPRWEARHEEGFAAASFNPDGRTVLIARRGEQTVSLADASDGRQVLQVTHDEKSWFDNKAVREVPSARFDPTGTTFLTVGQLGRPKLWSADDGRLLHTIGHGLSNLQYAFSPDGTRLVHDSTGFATMTDARTGRRLATTKPETRSDSQVANILAIAFAPDGRTFATAVEDNARVWDAATCQPVTPALPGSSITSLSYSPDAKWLTTGSDARDACAVWEAATGRRVCTIPIRKSNGLRPTVAFSPAGRHLAVNLGGAVELWEYRPEPRRRAGAPGVSRH